MERKPELILAETPDGLDPEGTVVVPTAALLAAACAQESTWEKSSRIEKRNELLTVLNDVSIALHGSGAVNDLPEFVLALDQSDQRRTRRSHDCS